MLHEQHRGALGLLLAALSLAWAATSGCCAQRACRTAGPERPQFRAVVRVVTACPAIHAGGGVAVGPRHVVTARHIVRCDDGAMPAILVSQSGRAPIAMRVDALDEGDLDVARLEAIAPGVPFVPWVVPSVSSVEEGDTVCIVTGMWVMKCGAAWPMPDGKLEVGVRGVYGNSGSPVFRAGELVGIVSSITESDASANHMEELLYAVSTSRWAWMAYPQTGN